MFGRILFEIITSTGLRRLLVFDVRVKRNLRLRNLDFAASGKGLFLFSFERFPYGINR